MIKYPPILSILFLLISTASTAQERKFEWRDTTFSVGQIKEVELQFLFDGPCTMVPCPKIANNGLVLDSIVRFMNNNPSIEIEIGVHSDQRGDERYNHDVTHIRAKGIKEILVRYELDPKRISYKAYGETKPLITQKAINKMKKKEEKEMAHAQNRRTEIKIIKL